MTYLEDLLRLRDQEITELRKRVEFLEAQIEVQQIKLNDVYYDENR